jgi:uncharacterized membrane protein (UPF0127 family)/sugar lactone lactonase YvrE
MQGNRLAAFQWPRVQPEGKKMSAKTRVFAVLFILCIFYTCSAYAGSVSSISLTAIPDAFNPSGGPLKINYTLNNTGNAEVSLLIIDNKGTVVRKLDTGNLQGLSGNVTWDGRLGDGLPAPEGNYTVKATANTGTIPVPQFFLRWGQSLLANGSGLNYYSFNPAIDGQDNLYVTDGRRDCVLKFDPCGNLLLKWGVAGIGNGQFSYPTGIAVDSSGNVYVADSKNQRVQKFDANGRYLLQFGGYGSGDGQFNSPSGIVTDKAGNVYVVDTWNCRVQYFDSKGTYLGKWGSSGSAEGKFNNPCGITIDDNSIVYVTDTYNDRVQKFSLEGTYLGVLSYTDNHMFYAPTGITVSGSGSLLVADSGNRRVSEYKPDGTCLRQEYAPAGYANPASRSAGSLALVISNGYIARWKPAGNDPEGFVCLTERGCLRVTALNPLRVGSATSCSATKKVILDRTAPGISLTAPSNGINYGRYQKVAAVWSAGDSLSGLGAAAGTVPGGSYIDTSFPGTHEFTVQASDKAGNVGKLTYRYNVLDSAPSPQSGQGAATLPVTSPGPDGNTISTPGPTPAPTPVPASGPTVVPGPIGAVVQLIAGSGSSTQIRAEVAHSSEELNQGLMYRTSMAGDRGMLFVFSGDGMHSFHMQNTYIPLDMIFISSDLKIVNIYANAQPHSTNWISSGSPCHYVLEVNAGVAGASGIHVGDRANVVWV